MSGASTPSQWTYAEYARLPDDGNRYEVLDGEVLVTPSPGTRHQRIAAALWRQLDAYVRAHGIGEVMWDLDLLFVSGQFLRPDIQYVPNAERQRLTERGAEGRPGLVVEILSPSSQRIDKVKKPGRYADFGVAEYWVVDPDRRAVLVWDFESGATQPRVEAERVVWAPEPDVPALHLEVPALFAAD
ncbi:MAG: Uma2 family endonuclease [Gemmatimonadota bacterium]